MEQWIVDLWKNKKWLFLLLIPVILLVVFRNLLIGLLLSSARNATKKAKEQDAKLREEAARQGAKADSAKKEADKLGEAANNVEDDAEWHKK